MSIRKTVSAIAAVAAMAVVLVACAPQQHLSPDFGDAVRQNMAVHIIDPRPMPVDEAGSALDGRRAAGAVDRYQRGQIIEPERLTTSTIGGGN